MRKIGVSTAETHTTTVFEESTAVVKKTALAATRKALEITIFYLIERLCAHTPMTLDKNFRSILTQLETSVFSESNLGTQKPNPPHLPFKSLNLKSLWKYCLLS